jgi:hypothetical protein
LSTHSNSRLLASPLLILTAWCIAGCTAAFGPGYTIEKQEIRVHFAPAPEPRILLDAEYKLGNTGNQPLSELEIRLPGLRRFHLSNPRSTWDGVEVTIATSPANPRNNAITLPQPWLVSSVHTLHLSVEVDRATDDKSLSFASDAFFLPAEGWSPELLPARGAFATGGVPPKKWELEVRVPETFEVHASGEPPKKRRSGGEVYIRAVQTAKDRYPFVIAGNYKTAQIGDGKQNVFLWTRATQEAGSLRRASDALQQTTHAYDDAFGTRSKDGGPIWIVECPVTTGCFTNSSTLNALSAPANGAAGANDANTAKAEMVSFDTLLADLSGGAQELATTAGPSLAASWLGYGKNPAFFEQDPPLYALPAFAAAIGRDATNGPTGRNNTIRSALRTIPKNPEQGKKETPAVIRAKSFLFFYALQDRYGAEVFRRATSHMFYARQGRGFDLDDLIAAFDQEAHQNLAQFVRAWMKRPGVPEEFRARYEKDSAVSAVTSKEATP